tara:strand:- start:51 stop:365 length:315 start_codon:yes stop_codon:yes gene_type:complete
MIIFATSKICEKLSLKIALIRLIEHIIINTKISISLLKFKIPKKIKGITKKKEIGKVKRYPEVAYKSRGYASKSILVKSLKDKLIGIIINKKIIIQIGKEELIF